MWTLVKKTARTDEPATTEAVGAPEPAAEPPVETTEAEDLNAAPCQNTIAVPWNLASQTQSSSYALQSLREALMSQWRNTRTPWTS